MPASSLPSAQEMNQQAHNYQRKMKRKYIISIICLIATIIFISVIGYFIEPIYITTRLGIVVTIGAIVLAIVSQTKLISILTTKESVELDSLQYLHQMIEYRKNMHRTQTSILSLYFMLLSIGISLYMFEYVMKMNNTYRIVTLSLTFGWIAFVWFYLRPKQIRKQEAQANEIISQLEKVCKQFE